MQGQSTSLLEVGQENLALRVALESLIRELTPDQRSRLASSLTGHKRGCDSYAAYTRVLDSLIRATSP
ncbi:hypothetical protein DM611_11650 [Stenotrophomonas maltophilia]|nr:hypothetical protein DM611_11650 [Stenotrophomonas maltophilia]